MINFKCVKCIYKYIISFFEKKHNMNEISKLSLKIVHNNIFTIFFIVIIIIILDGLFIFMQVYKAPVLILF